MEFDELGLQDKEREIYLQDLLEKNIKDIEYLTEEELVEKLDVEEIEEKDNENISSVEIDKQEEFSEEQLIESGKGWEEFTHIIKVKETDPIYKDFPGLEKPLILGYDKSGNFIANTTGENGEPVQSKFIEESRYTRKEVMHIGDKGEAAKEIPSGIMDTTKDNLKISIKIDQYGYLEAQKIQITHDNKWVATDIDREGSYDKTYDVKYETDLSKHGTCGNEELVENYEKQEESGDTNIELEEIEHNSIENIESIKRQVIDEALEYYNEMSREELDNFIHEELNNRLKDDNININEIAKEVKDEVNDEARFPTRGEKNN